jgi:predicted nucleic acid-binding protein
MYLLDTSVPELRKHKPQSAVLAWLNGIADDAIFLSAVTMGRASVRRGQPDQLLEDAMLAATAIVDRLTIVIRNTRDFELFSWSAPQSFQGEMRR